MYVVDFADIMIITLSHSCMLFFLCCGVNILMLLFLKDRGVP